VIQRILISGACLFSALCLQAQNLTAIDDTYLENDVVSLAGKKGFTFSSRTGDFLFKPYALVQASTRFNRYEDTGLDTPYADKVANSGFEIPNAILGFTGKAYNIVTFNLSMNAARSGGALLQQAWFDVAVKESFRIRAGKFKTPYTHAYLTTLGETLFPLLPSSLTQGVVLPYSLNAVNPSFATGFDLGVQAHGLVNGKLNYQAGIFNGTGINVNTAGKTMSDDHGWLPSLLYTGRLAYMPKGVMPATQGNPDDLNGDKMLFAISASYNVEAQSESSNDFRAGVELAWIKGRFYFAAEGYWLNMKFTKRQMISNAYNFWGAYAQAGYFITGKLQGALRYDLMDRNGIDKGGFLNMPAIGANYYFFGSNLKLQAMYQFMGRSGHETQYDRDDDGLGMPVHMATVMLQYTF
jgi:hypothetical protein